MVNEKYNHISDAPDFVKKYVEKKDQTLKFLLSKQYVHKDAFYSGISHFRDESGYINIHKKTDPRTLDQFVNSLVETYKKHAKEELGVDDANFAIKYYTGQQNKDSLKEIITEIPIEKFAVESYLSSQEFQIYDKKLSVFFDKSIQNEIKEEHLEPLKQYLHSKFKKNNFINYNFVNFNDSIKLLDVYIENKTLNADLIKEKYGNIPAFMDPNYKGEIEPSSGVDIKKELKEETKKEENIATNEQTKATPKPLTKEQLKEQILSNQVGLDSLKGYIHNFPNERDNVQEVIDEMIQNKTIPQNLKKELEANNVKNANENKSNNLKENENIKNMLKEAIIKDNLNQEQLFNQLIKQKIPPEIATDYVKELEAEGAFKKQNQ
jgi:uncharacterized protein (UPF0147 family)